MAMPFSKRRASSPASAMGSKGDPSLLPTPSTSGSVDFILRTAMERQSGNKRPIRPKLVDDSLLGDDSDDSDFNVDEHSGQSSGSEHSDASEDASGGNSEEQSDSSDSEVSSKKSSTLQATLQKFANDTSDFRPPAKKKKTNNKKNADKAKKNEATDKSKKGKKLNKLLNSKKIDETRNGKKLKKQKSCSNIYDGCIMNRVQKTTNAMRDIRFDIDLNRKICSFCLGEKSDESNEIVECDSCKITVHEGCYYMSDSQSNSSSNESSSLTEPWFCDYCKSPDSRCICALCPNPGGLLKGTADDQFVHLVCAFYTPGVISVIDNKANVSKIPPSKWGQKPCSLCSCVRLANTGVTVKCDAGMCKSYLHVSCAQNFGLLSDVTTHGNQEEADPFFAHCQVHGHKDHRKQRATLFKVLQEQIRIKKQKSTTNLTSTEKESQGRIQEKLMKIRAKIAARRTKSLSDGKLLVVTAGNGRKLPLRGICAKEFKRKPRSLKSCAYSVSRFAQKIENMGEDINSLELEEKNERIVSSINKRWNVAPCLGVEFAAYYFDREARIDSLSKQCQQLIKENESLNDKQIALNTVLENEAVDHMEMIDVTLTLDVKVKELKGILKYLSPGNKAIHNIQSLTPRPKSPPRKVPSKTNKEMAKHKAAHAPTSVPLPSATSTLTKKTPSRITLSDTAEGRFLVHVCATCKKSDQPHLITKCDKCNKTYHLGCLDPPLTRMPYRSRLCGWMCSDCDEQPEEEPVVDTEAPRALRGRTTIKRPEKYRGYDEDDEEEVIVVKVKDKRKNPPAFKINTACQPTVNVSSSTIDAAALPKSTIFKRPTLPSTGISKPTPALLPLNLANIKIEPLAYRRDSPASPPNISNRRVENGPTPNLIKFGMDSALKSLLCSSQPKKEIVGEPVQSFFKPILAPPRFIPILPKPGVKLDYMQVIPKLNPISKDIENPLSPINKSKQKSSSSKSPKLGTIETSRAQLQLNSTPVSETNFVSLNGGSHVELSKNLKVVLSPVNGLNDQKIASICMSPPMKTRGRKQDPNPSPAVVDQSVQPRRGRPRKSDPKSVKLVEKDALNRVKSLSQEIALAINYSSYGSHSQGINGKCSKCNKSEDKRSLVMCDDCKEEFHFTCVPPFMPYNPKRRGYKWVCEKCGDSDEEADGSGSSPRSQMSS